ncbi:hypothetical protein BRADI_5g06409v3 [Brachypodium distachyon]|uniref:Uncharacterized protein n=1 Tax=Brachypodium distachyon TaxID=15368 RepID=A0A0Q3E2W8_BRADI|nr:hypothetical protein BRADI_5g06409v3 [Brachypodium distachyon]
MAGAPPSPRGLPSATPWPRVRRAASPRRPRPPRALLLPSPATTTAHALLPCPHLRLSLPSSPVLLRARASRPPLLRPRLHLAPGAACCPQPRRLGPLAVLACCSPKPSPCTTKPPCVLLLLSISLSVVCCCCSLSPSLLLLLLC